MAINKKHLYKKHITSIIWTIIVFLILAVIVAWWFLNNKQTHQNRLEAMKKALAHQEYTTAISESFSQNSDGTNRQKITQIVKSKGKDLYYQAMIVENDPYGGFELIISPNGSYMNHPFEDPVTKQPTSQWTKTCGTEVTEISEDLLHLIEGMEKTADVKYLGVKNCGAHTCFWYAWQFPGNEFKENTWEIAFDTREFLPRQMLFYPSFNYTPNDSLLDTKSSYEAVEIQIPTSYIDKCSS